MTVNLPINACEVSSRKLWPNQGKSHTLHHRYQEFQSTFPKLPVTGLYMIGALTAQMMPLYRVKIS